MRFSVNVESSNDRDLYYPTSVPTIESQPAVVADDSPTTKPKSLSTTEIRYSHCIWKPPNNSLHKDRENVAYYACILVFVAL